MKRQAKRLWVLLLSLCLALTMTAVPAAGEEGSVASTAIEEVNEAANLQAAIDKTENATVRLTADLTISTTLIVNREVTLDLNGFMLKYENSEQNGSVIKVESSGKLTITDSRPEATSHKFKENEDGLWVLDESGDKIVTGSIITGGTGTRIDDENINYNFGGGIYIVGGQCTMEGGSIVGCQAIAAYSLGYGGGVYADENATFTMKVGSKVVGCRANNGGGVCSDTGTTVTMEQGANIISCRADNGGGVHVAGGTFNMEGGMIASCYASGNSGGGVEVSSEAATFIMQGDAEIHDCRVKGSNGVPPGRGGGVAAWGLFYMRDNSKITDCTAGEGSKGEGGGVYATGNFEMSGNAVIENCTATKGGGVFSFLITTISGNAKIDGTVYNIHTLNANGGTITGKVINENENDSASHFIGKITGDINGSITIFTGEVENKRGGIIAGGIFEGKVTNKSGGIINNGTFKGEVTNNGGIIDGGMFYGNVAGIDEKAYYIISFKNGDRDYAKQYIIATTANAKATEPLAPTREGYTFGGWYNGSAPWDFENGIVTQSMALTAKWTSTSSSGGRGHYSRTQTPQITCGSGGKAVLSADGRTLTITPDAEKEIDKVMLNGKELGEVMTVTNLKTGDKVEISFKDKVTEPTKEELDKQVKEAVAKVKLKARSVKLKNGRLRITISGDVQDLQNLQELGYTVKYKNYRSTRKASKYKAALEKAGTTFTTGKGTKGTRYYYKARLMVYDKDGRLIAKSELKQCRYATRILGK